MKKLLIIPMIFLTLLSYSQAHWGNEKVYDSYAKMNNKNVPTSSNELVKKFTQESYNLDEINHQIALGKGLFIGGIITSSIGVVLAISGINNENVELSEGSIPISIIGGLATLFGIPTWIGGVNKKADYSINLVSYNTGCGMGFKFNF